MVAKAAPNAQYAADILNNTLLYGVENPANKLRIKTGLHRRIHTNEYYGWANSVVISAYDSAKGKKLTQISNVLNALKAIRAFVESLDTMAPY